MFHPNLGRWMQQDPIGFNARDVNLYRYLGNHPTNATDPFGLKEKPPFPAKPGTISGAIDNASANIVDQGVQLIGIGGPPWGRPGYVKHCPKKIVKPVPVPKDQLPGLAKPGNNIASGSHAFFGPPNKPGQFFGTGGCETCVGLIIRCPGGQGAIFHFSANDAPGATLGMYDWSAFKGCTATVIGGNNEFGSRALFDQVVRLAELYFGGANVSVADSDHLHVGSDGEIYVRP